MKDNLLDSPADAYEGFFAEEFSFAEDAIVAGEAALERTVELYGGGVVNILRGRGLPVEGLALKPRDASKNAYTYSRGALGADETFMVSRDELLSCMDGDGDLSGMLYGARYVFVDGHVVLNDRRYVKIEPEGISITQYALTHMDECAVKFGVEYEDAPCDAGDGSVLNRFSNEEYRTALKRARRVYAPKDREFLDFKIEPHVREVLVELVAKVRGCETVGDVLTFLIRDVLNAKCTVVEQDLEIGHTMLERYLRGERKPSLKIVLAICIYFHLPPQVTRPVVSLLHYQFVDGSKEDTVYLYILESCWYCADILEINRALIKLGLEPLTQAI